MSLKNLEQSLAPAIKKKLSMNFSFNANAVKSTEHHEHSKIKTLGKTRLSLPKISSLYNLKLTLSFLK